jgi:hypothetical protein
MIKSLTPYYINIPLVNPITEDVCLSYVLEIYVWNGNKDSVPGTASYIVTKTNPTASNGTDKINIANLINDFIEFTPNKSTVTELNDGNNQVWVLSQVLYNDTPTISQIYNLQLCVKGYGYGLSGENPQPPTNKILIPIQDYKVNRNGFFNVPILIDEPTPAEPSLVLNSVTLDSGDDYILNYTLNFTAPSVRGFYKEDSDTLYTIPEIVSGGSGAIGTNEVTITIPITGDVDFKVVAFNPLTSTILNSNVIQIEI